MIINGATLAALFTGLKTTFNNAFAAAPALWPEIAMKVPSTTKGNDYAWLATFPRMRKWLGDKVAKALAAFEYTIVNDDWEIMQVQAGPASGSSATLAPSAARAAL